MAGFGKIAWIGEYYGNPIVNVLWYRSVDWLPLEGNPFAEMYHAMASIATHMNVAWLDCLPNDYTLLHLAGTGYDDAFNVVTPTPVILEMQSGGTGGAAVTSGAVLTADIKFVLGTQHSITGSQHSKRNRGYIAMGPVQESNVDNYGHLLTSWVNAKLGTLAQLLDDTVADVGGLTSLVPIRIHEGKTLGLIPWRTYSDIQGYQLPRRPGVRRSRLPNA